MWIIRLIVHGKFCLCIKFQGCCLVTMKSSLAHWISEELRNTRRHPISQPLQSQLPPDFHLSSSQWRAKTFSGWQTVMSKSGKNIHHCRDYETCSLVNLREDIQIIGWLILFLSPLFPFKHSVFSNGTSITYKLREDPGCGWRSVTAETVPFALVLIVQKVTILMQYPAIDIGILPLHA